MGPKSKLEKRLSSYWRMELANIVIVPVGIILTAFYFDSPIGWLTLFTMVPMCGLLYVGGLYWRGKHKRLLGERDALDAALAVAHTYQLPLLSLTIFACAASALSFGVSGLARGKGDLIAAAFAAILSALEYINYYHRQIQHFDHMADFKRLISGRGFRRAQMAQDLAVWRKKRP